MRAPCCPHDEDTYTVGPLAGSRGWEIAEPDAEWRGVGVARSRVAAPLGRRAESRPDARL